MSGPRRPFDPAELDGVGDDASQAAALAAARALEAVARADTVTPSTDFDDRVMAAIAVEPTPGRSSIRGGGLAGLFAAIGVAWADLWGAGRSPVIRAQALALLVVVAMVATSIGAIATVGVSNALFPDHPAPSVIPPSVLPSLGPTPPAVPSPSATPPTPSPTPPPTPSPTATPRGTDSAEPTQTDDGGGAGGAPTPKPTSKPTVNPTEESTHTPRPTKTADPTHTPDPTDDGSDDGGSDTPEPTAESGSHDGSGQATEAPG